MFLFILQQSSALSVPTNVGTGTLARFPIGFHTASLGFPRRIVD